MLHQCPCCEATKCIMDEPCLDCETYNKWLEEKIKKTKKKVFPDILHRV